MKRLVEIKFLLSFLGLMFSGVSALQAEVLSVGDDAPDFSLVSYDGTKHKLSDHRGEIVVLEWINPECPYVRRVHGENIMSSLAKKFKGKKVQWMAVNSTHFATDSDNKAWAEKHSLDYPILNDHTGEVGKMYGAKTTPHMFVIDDTGKLAYQGAIDDDSQGENENEKRINYVDASLRTLIAGGKVSPAETKPYGCSVKYKS